MTIYNWLCLFGVPGMVTAVSAYLINKIKKQKQEIEALKLGMQALLRAQMVNEYQRWRSEKSGVPLYVKDNFENVWKQYEALGKNGVMTDIHNRFVSLPVSDEI